MKIFKRLLIITFGAIIMAMAMVFFNAPNTIASGGVSGIAIIVNYLVPNLQIGLIVFILNVILFIIGYLILGREFGLLTLFGSISYSFWIIVLEKLFPISEPIVDDMILNVIFGAILTGVGMAFIYNQNASSGGTDILAKIVNHYTGINLGRSGLIIDVFIILGSFIFLDIQVALYSFFGTILVSIFIDNLITGFNTKIEMTISSNKIADINKFIIEKLDRSSTIYIAMGGYSKSHKNIIKTIVDKKEYFIIKEYISEIDKDAFVYVSHVNEVIGEGFTREKSTNV